jgi:hypothetical protein
MTDIVERLRGDWPSTGWHTVRLEAAAEIERLRADVAELCDIVEQLYARAARAALEPKP